MPQPIPPNKFLDLLKEAEGYYKTNSPQAALNEPPTDLIFKHGGVEIKTATSSYPGQLLGAITNNKWVWGYATIPECCPEILPLIGIFEEHPEWQWSKLYDKTPIHEHNPNLHGALIGVLVYLGKYTFTTAFTIDSIKYIVAGKL